MKTFKSLADVHPDLVKEWDFKKNEDKNLNEIRYCSRKPVWLKCSKCGHERKTAVRNISNKIKCIGCRSLAHNNPELTKEWHHIKNGALNPMVIGSGSQKKVWWKCSACNYEWKAYINQRISGKNRCPVCYPTIYKKDSVIFAVSNPELIKEWDIDKNGICTPYNSYSCSNKKIWWKCQICGYEWKTSIQSRHEHKNSGCKKCYSFGANYPELLKEWDLDLNKGIDPFLKTPGNSTIKINWKCSTCGSKWKATLSNRTNKSNKTGCPYCDGKKTNEKNCFASEFPELIKEWIVADNLPKTPHNVSPYSDIKVTWECVRCKNKWITAIKHRSKGENCPKCRKVVLCDGTVCDSYVEALFYLKYKENNKSFLHNKRYNKGFGQKRYDFYFPDENKYVEITSYDIKKEWKGYYTKIAEKKNFVENILKAKFEFIKYSMKKSEYQFVRKNMKIYN